MAPTGRGETLTAHLRTQFGAVEINSMLGHVVLIIGPRPNQFVPFKIEHLTTTGRFESSFDNNTLGFQF
jgi:hypothetical protein